jgi:flavin-dependent dehydrogenase
MEEYDVIIAGAGPAGLSIASELSNKYKVLIMEQGKIGKTNKSWLTYSDRLKKLGIPKSCVSGTFKKWYFSAGGSEFVINDNYATVYPEKVLKYWQSICVKNNASVIEHESFLSVRNLKKGVVVNGKFKALLLIDCCGMNSPIVRQKKLVKDIVYLNCYGAHISATVQQDSYYAFNKKKNNVWDFVGVTKLEKNTYFVLDFVYSEDKRKLVHLRNNFLGLCSNLDSNYKILDYKIDYYATGELKCHSFNNIYLFGDSSLFCPGFIGMGFNEILRQYKSVARHLDLCISKNMLAQKELETPVSIIEDTDNTLFRIVSLIINALDADDAKLLVESIRGIPNSKLKRLFRNTLIDDDIILVLKELISKVNIGKLIKNLPKRYVKLIIIELAKLSEDLFIDEIHDLIYKHHKLRIKDILIK